MARSLAILGIVWMGITMLVFGRDIERALQARCVAIVPLEVDKEAASGLVAVEPGRGCQVGVVLQVASKSIVKDLVRGEPQYLMRYGFSFWFRAFDEQEKLVGEGVAGLCWDDSKRHVQDEEATASGGRARVLHLLPKFDAPASGRVRVKATLAGDTEFGAVAEAAELRVYDNVTRPEGDVWLAAVALMVGPTVMMVGVVMGIAGWLRARRAQAAEGEGPEPPDGASAEAEGAEP
jgi:hypothetical protein